VFIVNVFRQAEDDAAHSARSFGDRRPLNIFITQSRKGTKKKIVLIFFPLRLCVRIFYTRDRFFKGGFTSS
jgi:hypothetical protein